MELLELLGVDLGNSIAELDLAGNRSEVGLVDNSVEPPRHVDKGLAESGVQDLRVEMEQRGRNGYVGQGDALAHKVRTRLQVGVQDGQYGSDIFFRSLEALEITRI